MTAGRLRVARRPIQKEGGMNYRGHHIDTLHAPAGWVARVDRMFIGIAGDEVSAVRCARRFVDQRSAGTRSDYGTDAKVVPIGLALMQGIGAGGDWEG